MNYKILRRNKYRYGEIAKAFVEGVKTVNMSKKQKVAFIIILSVFCIQIFTSISGTTVFAQQKAGVPKNKKEAFQKNNADQEKDDIAAVIEQAYQTFKSNNAMSAKVSNDLEAEKKSYLHALNVIAVMKGIIHYISDAQLASVEAINELKFGDRKMFSGILMGLTIFACIACVYKLFKHFADTERHDNVKAFAGYFSYIGLIILFWFAPSITKYIASLAEPINASQVQSIVTEINKGLEPILKEDFLRYAQKILLAGQELENAGSLNLTAGAKYEISVMAAQLTTLSSIVQMFFYLLLGIILVTVLAIPLVVITVMIKILLSVMIYGTQLVFLLAFIPGLDKLWQSMIINMLNILLWSPIFNAVITFIIAIVTTTMGNASIVGILWMTVVAFILSSQAVTITTSAANVLIQGAGAGMAGAMSSFSSMNATSMVAKGASGIAKATGGALGKVGNTLIVSQLSK